MLEMRPYPPRRAGGFVTFTFSVLVRVVPQAHMCGYPTVNPTSISRYGCLT